MGVSCDAHPRCCLGSGSWRLARFGKKLPSGGGSGGLTACSPTEHEHWWAAVPSWSPAQPLRSPGLLLSWCWLPVPFCGEPVESLVAVVTQLQESASATPVLSGRPPTAPLRGRCCQPPRTVEMPVASHGAQVRRTALACGWSLTGGYSSLGCGCWCHCCGCRSDQQ